MTPQETALDRTINRYITTALVIGGIGVIAYFYLKNKYKDTPTGKLIW